MDTLAKFVGGAVLIVLFVAVVALLMSVPTWLLWNWLMPQIFGLKSITLFQALGINLLSGCLFGRSSGSSKKSD